MAKISCSAIHIQDTLIQFPSTLTIIAIDTNLTVLEFIKKTCNQDGIQVVACSESLTAVNALKEKKERFDWILIEADMLIMDGYEFLIFLKKEQINVPLIMMSWNDSWVSILEAFKLGAYDYWIKPLHEIQFKGLWIQLVKKCVIEDTWQKDSGCLIRRISDNSEVASLMVHRSNNNFEEGDDVDESCNPPPTKKPRVVWEEKLHGAFLNAIQKIGIQKAVPKKILETMNVPGLERGHVASHLQKYRKFLRQQQQKRQQQQNDMSHVSERQIEQQQSQQNDMSCVSWNTEPRMCAVERIQLQPSATAITNFHSGFTGNMEEEESNPNTQLAENFYADLAHDDANIGSNQNFQVGTLDDASIYELLSPSETTLVENPTMLQINNMQQLMHLNQIHPMNFQPSSTIISGNPAFVSQNYNSGMNMDHGSQSTQQGGNNIGEAIVDQYSTRDSVYRPQFQNAGFRSQNPNTDDKFNQQ